MVSLYMMAIIRPTTYDALCLCHILHLSVTPPFAFKYTHVYTQKYPLQRLHMTKSSRHSLEFCIKLF